MSTNQTLSTVIALAGSTDAALFAAFSDVQRAALRMVRDGNRNPFVDTLHDLSTMGKASRVVNVRTMIETAYSAACAEFDTHKRAHPDALGISQCIALDARMTFDAAEAAGKAARDAKASASKAAKAEAGKAVSLAAQSVSPLVRAFNLADALELIRAACAAGDEQALSGVETLAEAFFDVAETA